MQPRSTQKLRSAYIFNASHLQECSGVCPEVWWRGGEGGVVWRRCSTLSTELLDKNGSEKVVRKSIWSEERTHGENKQYARVLCIHESMNVV